MTKVLETSERSHGYFCERGWRIAVVDLDLG
jgi:hypothetical protein